MTRFSDSAASVPQPGDGWHIPAAVLAAYAAEDISEADAWSTEAHLARCGRCRVDFAALVDSGPLHSDVAAARTAVMARLGGPDRELASTSASMAAATRPAPSAPAGRPLAMARWARPVLVLRGPWVTAVLVAVFVAAAAELVSSHASGVFGQLSMLALLGPLVPLAGVGLCYRATDRGWAEAVLATPSAGLRLVLWRVLAVLAVAIPITAIVAVFDHRAGPVTWLLPTLALAAASLALGTRIELGRATAVVAGAWAVAVVAPAFTAQHIPVEAFSGVAQGIWAFALVVCLAVISRWRAEFGRLPSWRPAATAQEQ